MSRAEKEAAMTLYEMGEEYLRQARDIKEQITVLRSRLSKCGGLELYRLRGEILRLYAIARDLKSTGDYLIHYYEKE